MATACRTLCQDEHTDGARHAFWLGAALGSAASIRLAARQCRFARTPQTLTRQRAHNEGGAPAPHGKNR